MCADSKRAPAREIFWVMDSSGQGKPMARTKMGSAKEILEQTRRSRSVGRDAIRAGSSSCSETWYPAPRPDSTRTMRAGVSGGTPAADEASKGNTTQTREPVSQDSLRRTRMPLRETSSVCVDSMRMPSGPRQRTRAGSFSWARGCLRNSRKVGARFISAIVAARAKQVKLRREYLHEVRITERELGAARRS
jgi:hypothetical protein